MYKTSQKPPLEKKNSFDNIAIRGHCSIWGISTYTHKT